MTPISGATCEICGDGLGSPVMLNGNAPHLAASVGRAPSPADFEGHVARCLSCQEETPHFSKAVAYGSYDDELRELIHLLKYDRVEPAANVLGTMLAEAIEKLNLGTGSVLVIPVPLHVSKRRERRFNQAELIVRKALKKFDEKRFELTTNVLERTRPTVSQIGLTRPQRIENLRGAFRVAHLSRVRDRDVLLVDDVMTTGTTASECARVLRKAGAQNVYVATVARTLKQDHTGLAMKFSASTGEDASAPRNPSVEARAPVLSKVEGSSPVLES
jgi:ComF family protein